MTLRNGDSAGEPLPPARFDALCLIVRSDGTFDYRYADGFKDHVIATLREIADKIEQGTIVEHPK